MANLDKLNRLRQNAGKPPLKSWKASKDKLIDAIKVLEEAGHLDVLPGANPNAAPQVGDDPELAKALLTPDKKNETDASEEGQEKAEAELEKREEKKPTKVKAELARGVAADHHSAHSRKSLHDQRQREKKATKNAKDEEKKLAKGQVDPDKEPEKAARQQKHIEDKKAKREKEGKATKPAKEKSGDEITVAEIARELSLDPKIARAKLRRYEGKDSYPDTVKGERWTFPMKAKKTLIDILTGKKA